jgi:peroxiredoxin
MKMTSFKSHHFLSVLALTAFLLAWCGCNHNGNLLAPGNGTKVKVENFVLLDQHGHAHELYYYSDAKAVVLYVHGNGCPIARNQIPTLKAIRNDFAKQNVAFLMLNANPQDNRENIAREAQQFDIDFPILVDEVQLVSQSLGIDRTCETIVIDPRNWTILYRGPIDDRLNYESQKKEASQEYLKEALTAHLDGKQVNIDAPAVKGCKISFPEKLRSETKPISYNDDIAPILKRCCIGCHREGAIGPWAMTDYATVQGWAAMIREVILTKRMPPWNTDPHIGEFSNNAALTLEEERLLIDWIDEGAPRGDGVDSLTEVTKANPNEWTLGQPDLILYGKPQSIPATGVIPYRYDRISVPLPEGTWVRGIEILPSNPKVLHHALVMHLDFERKDAKGALWINTYPPPPTAPPNTVWINWPEEIMGTYLPGTKAQLFPDGTGKFLMPNSKLLMQYHYTTTGRPEIDAPRIGIYLSKTVPPHTRQTTAAVNQEFRIPPNEKEYRVSATHTFDEDVVLYKLQPHMHYRGKWMNVEAHYPDGKVETILSVPNFHFDWQRYYTLKEPVSIPAGTRIVANGAFDNSSQNRKNPDPSKWLQWGLKSTDEMFGCFLVYRSGNAVDVASDENPSRGTQGHRFEGAAQD